MRKASNYLLGFLLLLFFLVGIGCAASKSPSSSSGIPARPDKLGLEKVEFTPQKPETWKLDNGLTVYYLYDNELPLIDGTLYYPGGALFEPADRSGIASATGNQMREGGIPGYSSDQLNKHLNDLAASIETGFGGEYGTSSFSALAENFDEIFSLFSSVVRTPQFDPERLNLWKKLSAEGIRRRRDDPVTMAGMAFSKLVYGENSPYARISTYNTVSKITRADMLAFHHRFVRPQGAILALTGSIPRAEVERVINKYFASWTGPTDPMPPFPPVGYKLKPGVYLLPREFDQATVFIGHLGPPRLTPDMQAMEIFNRVLSSGGFESVLFSEVRSKLGLAYSIEGALAPGPVAGVYEIILQSRAPESLAAVKRTLEIVRQSREDVLPADRIANSKSAVEKTFVFKFAGADALVTRAALLQILKYPSDYDATYLAKIDRVDGEAVREVAKKWVFPDSMAIVIVGNVKPEDVQSNFPGLSLHKLEFDIEPHVVD